MKLTISFDINPGDYGRAVGEHEGVAIAAAIYNGYADPPEKAVVQVDGSQWHGLVFGPGGMDAIPEPSAEQ